MPAGGKQEQIDWSDIPDEAPKSSNSSIDTQSLADDISKIESQGNYRATNPSSSAAGKYQFLYDTFGDDIQRVTGVKSKREFLHNPEAQEKFFQYHVENNLLPAVEKLKSLNKQGYSDSQLAKLVHFKGEQGAIDFLSEGADETKKHNISIPSYIGTPAGQSIDWSDIPDEGAVEKKSPVVSESGLANSSQNGQNGSLQAAPNNQKEIPKDEQGVVNNIFGKDISGQPIVSANPSPAINPGTETPFVDKVLDKHKNLEWVNRLYDKHPETVQIPGEEYPSTHFMASDEYNGKYYAYPTVQKVDGKLKYLGKDAFDYSLEHKTAIPFDSEDQANWFAANGYKKGTGVLPELKKQEVHQAVKDETGHAQNVLMTDVVNNAQDNQMPDYLKHFGVVPFTDKNSIVHQITDPHGDPAITGQYNAHRTSQLENAKQQEIAQLENKYPSSFSEKEFGGESGKRGVADQMAYDKERQLIEDKYDSQIRQVRDASHRITGLQMAYKEVDQKKYTPAEADKEISRLNDEYKESIKGLPPEQVNVVRLKYEQDKADVKENEKYDATQLGIQHQIALGDKQAQEDLTRYKNGIEINPERKVAYQADGLNTMQYASQNAKANGKDEVATELDKHSDNIDERLVNDNPKYFRQLWGNQLGDYIYKNIDNPLYGSLFSRSQLSEDDIKKYGKKAGLSDKQIKMLKPEDIPTAASWGAQLSQSALNSFTFQNENSDFGRVFTGKTPRAQHELSPSNIRGVIGEMAAGAGTVAGFIGQSMIGGELLKGTELLGDVALNAKRYEQAANLTPLAISNYNNAYATSKEVIGDKPEDEMKRQAFTALNTIIGTALMSIDPATVIGKDALGMTVAGKGIINTIKKEGLENITRDEFKTQIQKVLTEAIPETGKHVGSQAAIMGTAKAAENITDMMFDPEHRHGVMDNVGEAALHAGISMLIPSMAAGARSMKSNTPANKAMLFDIGSNPKEYRNQVSELYRQGKLTKDEAIQSYDNITAASSIINTQIPRESVVNNKELSVDQKQDYAYNLLQEKELTKQMDALPEDEKTQRGILSKKIKDLDMQRQEILTKAGEVPGYEKPTLPVVDEPAEDKKSKLTSELVDKLKEAVPVYGPDGNVLGSPGFEFWLRYAKPEEIKNAEENPEKYISGRIDELKKSLEWHESRTDESDRRPIGQIENLIKYLSGIKDKYDKINSEQNQERSVATEAKSGDQTLPPKKINETQKKYEERIKEFKENNIPLSSEKVSEEDVTPKTTDHGKNNDVQRNEQASSEISETKDQRQDAEVQGSGHEGVQREAVNVEGNVQVKPEVKEATAEATPKEEPLPVSAKQRRKKFVVDEEPAKPQENASTQSEEQQQEGAKQGGEPTSVEQPKSEKERSKILINELLDTDGDVDKSFGKAGYVNVDGLWVHPDAVEYYNKLSDKTKEALKKNGIKYFSGGDGYHGAEAGSANSISHDGTAIHGVHVRTDVGEHFSGHDHVVIHEAGHAVWDSLSDAEKKLFHNDNPLSAYAKEVKKSHEAGKPISGASHGEEDFAELFAKNGGDLKATLKEASENENNKPNTEPAPARSVAPEAQSDKRNSVTKKSKTDASIQSKEQQPEGNKQSGKPEHARAEQARSEKPPAEAKNSNSDIGGEKKEVRAEESVMPAKETSPKTPKSFSERRAQIEKDRQSELNPEAPKLLTHRADLKNERRQGLNEILSGLRQKEEEAEKTEYIEDPALEKAKKDEWASVKANEGATDVDNVYISSSGITGHSSGDVQNKISHKFNKLRKEKIKPPADPKLKEDIRTLSKYIADRVAADVSKDEINEKHDKRLSDLKKEEDTHAKTNPNTEPQPNGAIATEATLEDKASATKNRLKEIDEDIIRQTASAKMYWGEGVKAEKNKNTAEAERQRKNWQKKQERIEALKKERDDLNREAREESIKATYNKTADKIVARYEKNKRAHEGVAYSSVLGLTHKVADHVADYLVEKVADGIRELGNIHVAIDRAIRQAKEKFGEEAKPLSYDDIQTIKDNIDFAPEPQKAEPVLSTDQEEYAKDLMADINAGKMSYDEALKEVSDLTFENRQGEPLSDNVADKHKAKILNYIDWYNKDRYIHNADLAEPKEKNNVISEFGLTNGDQISHFLSGKTIELRTGDKPLNEQQVIKYQLELAAQDSQAMVSKMKHHFGIDVVKWGTEMLKQINDLPGGDTVKRVTALIGLMDELRKDRGIYEYELSQNTDPARRQELNRYLAEIPQITKRAEKVYQDTQREASKTINTGRIMAKLFAGKFAHEMHADEAVLTPDQREAKTKFEDRESEAKVTDKAAKEGAIRTEKEADAAIEELQKKKPEPKPAGKEKGSNLVKKVKELVTNKKGKEKSAMDKMKKEAADKMARKGMTPENMYEKVKELLKKTKC